VEGLHGHFLILKIKKFVSEGLRPKCKIITILPLGVFRGSGFGLGLGLDLFSGPRPLNYDLSLIGSWLNFSKIQKRNCIIFPQIPIKYKYL
jgi:hypothetical protein